MERHMLGAEPVSVLRGLMLWERAVLAPLARGDVDTAALHEMARQPSAPRVAVERACREFDVEQSKQPVEGRFVAAVRRRRQQNEVALAILRETLEQLEPLLPALMGADARMRFVDHHRGHARAKPSRRRSALM
jgi:hypothetical protein